MPCRRALGAVALALAVTACDEASSGKAPPPDEMFFPGGMLLDPRAPQDEPARYLFVANGNNDLTYNTGSVVTLDLQAYFASWALPDTFAIDPWCGEDRCVQYVGSDVTRERPCRRLSLRPNVVECTEDPFVVSGVQVGDFATLLTSSCEAREGTEPDERLRACTKHRLWLPVRGDPSISYIDIESTDPDAAEPWQSVPRLACDQHPRTGRAPDGEPWPELEKWFTRCDIDEFDQDKKDGRGSRLTHLFNDLDLPALGREPFTMLVSPTQRLGFVAHSDGDQLTTIDLGDSDTPPRIVGQAGVFFDSSGLSGGFGLAERPCHLDDAPSITEGCSRPLVYASFRYVPFLASFTVDAVDLGAAETARDCLAEGEELGMPGVVPCSAQVRSVQRIFPGGLDPQSSSVRAVLGDIAFADDAGNELLVVQTNPAALLKLDTSIGPDGAPLDTPSAPPIELCEEPTRLRLFEDAGQRYALVSCFRAAEIFVIDLDAFQVVRTIRVGTGPWEIEIDRPRRLLYVANTLEKSISIIDLARDRPTRFDEIARIGLQEPFSR